MDRDIYEITNFPNDGQLWRVNLFGEVRRNLSVPSDPSVEVLMSPTGMTAARVHALAPNAAVDYARQRSVWINAGYLPLVRIGSLWRDGTPVAVPQRWSVEARFADLTITARSARLVPANMRLGKGYLIPQSVYRLGQRGLQTQFLSVDYGGIPHHLLIPVMEIGRFYYFGSTALTKRLLWGRLDDRGGDIFDGERSGRPINGVGHVCLRMHIPYEDKWVVSRLAHSPIAYARARLIHDSLARKAANGQPLMPDILPPFVGRTDLIVHGKWFWSAGQRHFIVWWIKSCSHPFPASHLIYTRDNDASTDGEYDPTRPEVRFPERKTASQNHMTRTLRGDTEPRAEVVPLEPLLHDVRFTDLLTKTEEKLEKTQCRFRAAPRATSDTAAVNSWSSGDGTFGESDAGPIALRTGDDEPNAEVERRSKRPSYPPSLEAVQQAIAHLAKLADITYRFVQPIGGSASEGTTTSFPAGDGKRPGWAYIGGRRRRVLIVEIVYTGTYHYVLEAERRPTEHYTTLYVRDPQASPLADLTLTEILEYCVKNTGKWLEPTDMPHLSRRKIRHTWASPAAFATTLVGLVGCGVSVRGVEPAIDSQPSQVPCTKRRTQREDLAAWQAKSSDIHPAIDTSQGSGSV